MAVVLTATFANAQVREKGTIEIIPQIGYSSSNYYGNDVGSGNSPITSVSYGVAGDYFFNKTWSLRSGLLFQTMGTEIIGIKEKLNYLTIPINANWHFGSTKKWNLNFGPSFGFLMSAKDDSTDIKDLTNSTQFGLNYGIGYKIEVSDKISILIDYQGMSGFSDVSKDSSTNIKNAYGSFDVGCVFKL